MVLTIKMLACFDSNMTFLHRPCGCLILCVILCKSLTSLLLLNRDYLSRLSKFLISFWMVFSLLFFHKSLLSHVIAFYIYLKIELTLYIFNAFLKGILILLVSENAQIWHVDNFGSQLVSTQSVVNKLFLY